ncbi:MAG TPA: cytochrome c peroxidase [Nitrospirota bacterium]|nr:cytochrome c peroxidase [Nitrospirota bacterium]
MNGEKSIRAKQIMKYFAILIIFSVAIFSGNTVNAASADTELMNQAKTIFGPLPSSMVSADNPITPAKVKLGHILFWEPRISIDGTVSCVKCHPFSLYAADGLRKAIGNHCLENPRNSPSIFNAADQIAAHWIGNRTGVEDQAKQALIGPPSYGMPNYESVEKILKGIKEYVILFQEAFPADKDPVTVDNFSKAVGAFERTLVTPAPFDDFMKGNANALTPQQKRGLKTFISTGCVSCHMSPYLGGKMFQKFGVFQPYEQYTKSAKVDEGHFAVTKNPSDKFFFKVPVLRNVAETPPYFQDGSVDKLEDAIMIMAKIQLAKDLKQDEVGDIMAFFKSLTGKIPDIALTVPILPSAQ